MTKRSKIAYLNKNRVTAISNPVHSPQVEELYLNIISGKSSASAETKQTTAFFKRAGSEVRFSSDDREAGTKSDVEEHGQSAFGDTWHRHFLRLHP